MSLEDLISVLSRNILVKPLVEERNSLDSQYSKLLELEKSLEQKLLKEFLKEVNGRNEIITAVKLLYLLENGVKINGVTYDIFIILRNGWKKELNRIIERMKIDYSILKTAFWAAYREDTERLLRACFGENSSEIMNEFIKLYQRVHNENYEMLRKLNEARDKIEELKEKIKNVNYLMSLARKREEIIFKIKEFKFLENQFNERELYAIFLEEISGYPVVLIKDLADVISTHLEMTRGEKMNVDTLKYGELIKFVREIKEFIRENVNKEKNDSELVTIGKKLETYMEYFENYLICGLDEYFRSILGVIQEVGIPVMTKRSDPEGTLTNAMSYLLFLRRLEENLNSLDIVTIDGVGVMEIETKDIVQKIIDKYLLNKYGKHFKRAVQVVEKYRNELEKIAREAGLI